MTDRTNAPETDAQPGSEPGGARPHTEDDHGAALERSAESIREAHDAEATVAAHDDITVLDDQRAGEYSEDPDGEGGHP